jgi:hypothetical protein
MVDTINNSHRPQHLECEAEVQEASKTQDSPYI